MALRMLGDNCAEASLRASDRSVNKSELCNIILVNHVQNWFLLYLVHSCVQQIGLGSSLHLLVAVRRDQVSGFVLWLSVDSLQGLW